MLRLSTDPEAAGLHTNPQWQRGTPGTFAVIVGVSRYRFLSGGQEWPPGKDSFGLGQLHVSALTAHRFFEWIATQYLNDAAPLAQCWLLLAPTPGEVKAESALAAAIEPTIANVERAIKAWYGSLKALPRPAAEQSRAVFFFSGHGIEVQTDRQLLLPADFLEPPVDNLNDAISTSSILRGLGGLPISQVLFFLDACRNDVPALRNFEVTGRSMLPIPVAAETNPDQISLLYYAAASGQQTWQPFEVKEGASVFGRALFDGLTARPGLELRCSDTACSIDSFPLHAYLKQRVAAILADYQSQEKARVRMGGSVDDFSITSVPPPVRKPTRGLPSLRSVRRIEETLDDRYTVSHTDLSWQPLTSEHAVSHNLLGSENMTWIWEQAKVLSLRDGRRLEPEQLRISRVDRSEDTLTYRFELELPADPVGHWLQLADPAGAEWACVLGGDGAIGAPRYTLEVGLEQPDDRRQTRWISRVGCGLSINNPDPWRNAALVWDTYEFSHLGGAVKAIDLQMMEKTLQSKRRSALAATVAGSILLRARRWDLLHQDWLYNLSQLFELPDGAVLWSEQVRLTQGWTDEAVAERLRSLELLSERGLPHLAEVFVMASAALQDFEPQELLTAAARALLERMRLLTPLHRPGGLFTVFTGRPGSLTPDLLRPPG